MQGFIEKSWTKTDCRMKGCQAGADKLNSLGLLERNRKAKIVSIVFLRHTLVKVR